MRFKLTEIREGGTRLLVPLESIEREVPPTVPAFFNPAASVNRDVSVAITEAARGAAFCDGLAGTGARGLRIAKEVTRKMDVTLVDFNRDALEVAEKSARSNGVLRRCRFVCEEARTFLNSRYGRGERFDFVDIDPFGSPAPFLQAMVAATANGGVVSATATDTAALCGVYPSVSRRRYSATSLNNSFHHETGARILLNAIRRHAAAVDKGVVPMAAHSTKHYIRVYARIEDGPKKADEAVKGEGYVTVCSKCSHVTAAAFPARACDECGGTLLWAGPLWVGKLADGDVLGKAKEVAIRRRFREAARILDSLSSVDSFPPWSFSLEEICSRLGVATVSGAKVGAFLRDAGFASGRQPFEKTGLKTDAPYSAVVDAVRNSTG
jgi:tRNA (guanine26-N2/guanine27-N2)-dimethyltransferase